MSTFIGENVERTNMKRFATMLAGNVTAMLILIAAPAAAADSPDLKPTSQAAIIAGAKACLGTTVDPVGQPGRFAEWVAATPEQARGMKTDGAVVTRDKVMVVYKTGKDGGCVVMAAGDDAFDAKSFTTQLSATVGAIGIEPNGKPVSLPNGELLIVTVSPKTPEAASNIVLVFANSAGKYAKKGN
jgi:hypothetical protein